MMSVFDQAKHCNQVIGPIVMYLLSPYLAFELWKKSLILDKFCSDLNVSM